MSGSKEGLGFVIILSLRLALTSASFTRSRFYITLCLCGHLFAMLRFIRMTYSR